MIKKSGFNFYIGIACCMVMAIAGCGRVTSSTSESSPVTTVSFSISPQKAKYTAGESFTITMMKVGPRSVSPNVERQTFHGSFSGLPTVSGLTITGKAGNTSGSKLTLVCGPDHTLSINDVPQIVVSGNATFEIETQ